MGQFGEKLFYLFFERGLCFGRYMLFGGMLELFPDVGSIRLIRWAELRLERGDFFGIGEPPRFLAGIGPEHGHL